MTPGSEARGWHEGAGCNQLPADVDYIVDGSWVTSRNLIN